METKTCIKCNITKPLSEYHRSGYHKDGSIKYRSYCKECANIIERNRYWEKKNFVETFKTNCAKCGETRKYLLDFHHINPKEKEFTIGKLHKGDKELIKKEIEKCICLCANCHREYHHIEPVFKISTEEYINSNENWTDKLNQIDRQQTLFDEREKQIIETVNNKIIVANKIITKPLCSNCGKELFKASKTGLCFDCYTKTIRVCERPNREELKQLIRTLPFTQIGKLFNVSDNAIRKWCDAENLPRTVKEIKSYSDEEWEAI